MGFGFDAPSVKPPPAPPPPPPIDDSEEKRRLAAQRRNLERLRQGRRSLRVEPTRNPGVASGTFAGLRLPQ